MKSKIITLVLSFILGIGGFFLYWLVSLISGSLTVLLAWLFAVYFAMAFLVGKQFQKKPSNISAYFTIPFTFPLVVILWLGSLESNFSEFMNVFMWFTPLIAYIVGLFVSRLLRNSRSPAADVTQADL